MFALISIMLIIHLIGFESTDERAINLWVEHVLAAGRRESIFVNGAAMAKPTQWRSRSAYSIRASGLCRGWAERAWRRARWRRLAAQRRSGPAAIAHGPVLKLLDTIILCCYEHLVLMVAGLVALNDSER